jgi:uncharacterized repeat protein (TIGR04138 family)
MPPTDKDKPAGKDEPAGEKTLAQIVNDLGLYPIEAFHFIEQGLGYAVRQIHGEAKQANPTQPAAGQATDVSRHITGQQLCEGLRQYALLQWGLLAGTVLRRWNITCTYDFGRIVFALVQGGKMQKTEHDDIEDFRNVYDFKTAFESDYRIEHKS